MELFFVRVSSVSASHFRLRLCVTKQKTKKHISLTESLTRNICRIIPHNITVAPGITENENVTLNQIYYLIGFCYFNETYINDC